MIAPAPLCSYILVLVRALAIALIFSGCVPRKVAPSAAVAPMGVLIPRSLMPGDLYRGLYVAGGDSACCWTAPRAALSVRKTFDARHIVLVFMFPTEMRS